MGLWNTLRFIVNHPLNRGRPVAAVGRYVGWQVRSRLSGRPVAVAFVEGSRLVVGEQNVVGKAH